MVILMGIAGSGKGTQGVLLAQKIGFKVISTGEMIRNYGSKDQLDRIHSGILLSDDEITKMLDAYLGDLDDQSKVILDGYPRTKTQAQWLLDQAKTGRFKIDYVLHLIASRQAVLDRLTKRGRHDDHGQAIEARFAEFERSTLPIIDFYKNAGLRVAEISGEDSVENVQTAIMEVHEVSLSEQEDA